MFWQSGEHTSGGVYSHDIDRFKKFKVETAEDCRIRLAKESRQKVLDHPKWNIFEKYAAAMGIDKVPEVAGWPAHQERFDKLQTKVEEDKRIAELKKQRAIEEERKRVEQEEVAKA